MHMKRSRMRELTFMRKNVTRDNEGVPTISYTEPITTKGEVWTASDSLQVEVYGDRIRNIINARIVPSYDVSLDEGVLTYTLRPVGWKLREGDGVCVYSNRPDYKVVAIKPYHPMRLELEKL